MTIYLFFKEHFDLKKALKINDHISSVLQSIAMNLAHPDLQPLVYNILNDISRWPGGHVYVASYSYLTLIALFWNLLVSLPSNTRKRIDLKIL